MPQEDLVTLSIDGREVSVPRGSTVLHAAQQLGIDIPTFCYSKKMDPLGACRMCLVSIEKAKGFPPSCATPVAPGMVVRTTTPEVQQTQKGMLEFLLINHPLDCPICDKGGECPLQNLTFKYGPGKSRYTEEKRHFVKHLPIGPQIVLDRERCIVCQLCVRFMEDVADDPQIVLMARGGKTEVNVFPDRPFDSPFAGNTIELCPVGALTSSKYRFRARPWDLKHSPSICPSCAVGCNVSVDTRRNEILRLYARENLAVDDGWLCDFGRFGTLDRLRAGEQVTSPMVRRDGVLVETSWDEALDAAAEGLDRARHTGVAALAGPRSPNEELYLLGRIFRANLRSADVAVPGGSSAPTALLGGAAIADLEAADRILLIDADPKARQHVLDLRIRKQIKRRQVPVSILANEATALDLRAAAIGPFDAAHPAETIRQLIALLDDPSATAPEAVKTVAATLRGSSRGLVVYDERLLSGDAGQDTLAALMALSAKLGTADGAPTRPLALARAANSRGAAEMGAQGAWMVGGVEQGTGDVQARLGQVWGAQPVNGVGRSRGDIFEAARQGAVRGLFFLDYDPILEGEEEAHAVLARAPFLVVQAARTSPVFQYANVVFPNTAFAETAGTFTNTEGRVQRLRSSVVASTYVREGWQVLADLGLRLGGAFGYRTVEDVTQEIARVSGLDSWAEIREQAVLAPVGATR
jgi:NADH-quinone oxidoreductase subunit G